MTHDPPHATAPFARRALLRAALGAIGTVLIGRPATARPKAGTRLLDLHAINTGERLRAAYAVDGRYQPDVLAAVSRLMRDHWSGDLHPIEPSLLDVMHLLVHRLGSSQPIQVVCGYRSPETNRRKLAAGHGVARHSLHMSGRAVDLTIPGRSPAGVRRAALSLRLGGVGYYPRLGFVHVDTGPVRTW